MTNFGARILNNAVSSLRAQQALIANTGNNIANVDTPGYTRRTLQLKTADGSREAGLSLGNGVRLGNVERMADSFLQKLVFDTSAEKSSNQMQNDFLSRIEKIFSLTGDRNTIGSTINEFFGAVNDLTANPSSIELRTNVIERANEMVETIKQTYNYLAGLQKEADQRISTELQTVNALTSSIAQLNLAISQAEAGDTGGVAADERDQRDQLMAELADKVSYSSVEMADGTVTISLSNGFALVNGTNSRALEVTNSPSFASGNLPPSLNGETLSYVVYNGGGSNDIDLTKVLQGGDGTIGGYLKLRGYADPTNTSAFQANGTIVEVAAIVEAIARSLLTDFNQQYLGPDRDTSTDYHDPSSGDLDGNTPDVFGLFDFEYSDQKDWGNELTPDVPDGLPKTSDLDYLLQQGEVKNFASILKLNFSDPRRLAAARDSSAPPHTPAIFGSGDGRNMQKMAEMQGKSLQFLAGSYSLTSTIEEAYNQTVGYVGNLKAASDVATQVSSDNYTTASDKRDQVSAVSLDEEFTDLISYQKAYQASAKMIRIAQDLMQEVIQLI